MKLYLWRVENRWGVLLQNKMSLKCKRLHAEISWIIYHKLPADNGLLKMIFLRLLILIFFFLFCLFDFFVQIAFPLAVEFRLIPVYTENRGNIFFVQFKC